MSRSLGQASHPTMPVFMTPKVRNRDHGVVKQTNKQTNKQIVIIDLISNIIISITVLKLGTNFNNALLTVILFPLICICLTCSLSHNLIFLWAFHLLTIFCFLFGLFFYLISLSLNLSLQFTYEKLYHKIFYTSTIYGPSKTFQWPQAIWVPLILGPAWVLMLQGSINCACWRPLRLVNKSFKQKPFVLHYCMNFSSIFQWFLSVFNSISSVALKFL